MKTFLHIGCGPKHKDKTTQGFNTAEWNELRLDIDDSVNPDIVGTMTDMSAVESESVDAIFSSHNIEHLYPHEAPVALKEFLRVLKPEATLASSGFQSIAILCRGRAPYFDLGLGNKNTMARRNRSRTSHTTFPRPAG